MWVLKSKCKVKMDMVKMNSENEFLSIPRVYRVTSSQEDQNNQCGRMFIYC